MAADGNPGVHLETGNHPKTGQCAYQGKCGKKMGELEKEINFKLNTSDEENDSMDTKRKKWKARAAMTTWKERTESVRHEILEVQSEMRSIMNEVYQLVGLYSVFVGVVLTAVSTSSRLECQHLWSPVLLSFFATLMVVVVALTKFREISDLEKKKEINRREIEEIENEASKLKDEGYDEFRFGGHCQKEWSLMSRNPYVFSKNALGLIVSLSIFLVGLVFSLVHIFCLS